MLCFDISILLPIIDFLHAATDQCMLFLCRQLKLMATVHQTQPTIQLLLSTSDFVGALDLIATTQEVLQQELAGVRCLR